MRRTGLQTLWPSSQHRRLNQAWAQCCSSLSIVLRLDDVIMQGTLLESRKSLSFDSFHVQFIKYIIKHFINTLAGPTSVLFGGAWWRPADQLCPWHGGVGGRQATQAVKQQGLPSAAWTHDLTAATLQGDVENQAPYTVLLPPKRMLVLVDNPFQYWKCQLDCWKKQVRSHLHLTHSATASNPSTNCSPIFCTPRLLFTSAEYWIYPWNLVFWSIIGYLF